MISAEYELTGKLVARFHYDGAKLSVTWPKQSPARFSSKLHSRYQCAVDDFVQLCSDEMGCPVTARDEHGVFIVEPS